MVLEQNAPVQYTVSTCKSVIAELKEDILVRMKNPVLNCDGVKRDLALLSCQQEHDACATFFKTYKFPICPRSGSRGLSN